MALADRPKLVELARIAVDVDRDDGLRPLGDRGLDRARIQVERPGVDIREHRRRTLVDRAVRGRDEGVRSRNDLVTRSDARRDAEEVQARRAARDGGGVGGSDGVGECLLEALDRRPEREPAREQDVRDQLLLALVEPGRAEADSPRLCRHARAGAISTTSSQSSQRSSTPFTAAR